MGSSSCPPSTATNPSAPGYAQGLGCGFFLRFWISRTIAERRGVTCKHWLRCSRERPWSRAIQSLLREPSASQFFYCLVFGLLTHSPAGSFTLIEVHVVEICILDIETPGLLLFSKGHHLGLSSRRSQPAPEIMGKQPSRKI